ARLEGGEKMVHEALGGDEHHVAPGGALAHAPGHGVEKMGLAEPGCRMNEQRIEIERLPVCRLGDAHGGGVGKGVRAADHEGLEGERMIERRTAIAALVADAIGTVAIAAVTRI